MTDDFSKAEPIDPTVSSGTEEGSGSPFESLGAPGTAIYGGYIVSNEKDQKLKGAKRYETYSEILANVSIVSAGVRFFTDMVAKAAWSVEPADESAEAQRLADLVDQIINDCATPWHRIVKRASMYCFWGFGVQEWTAKRREDGVVGFLDIEPRAQKTIERWDLDVSGAVLGVVQRRVQDQAEVYLPREKIVYMVDDTFNDSPEGLGLFRHIVKAARRLERYELLEAWGFETDLRGVPIGRGPFSEIEKMVAAGRLSREQANGLKQPMLDFVSGHNKNPELAMLLDSKTYQTTDEKSVPSTVRQWDIDLLQGSPTSAAEVAAAIERTNREIARVLGVENLLLGGDGKGSLALSRDKTQSFGLLVDSCLKEMKETFEGDLLGPLWQLNGWDESLMPSFKIEKIQYRDPDQLAEALEKLARAGAPLAPDDPAINEIRGQLGLSEQVEPDLLDPDASLGSAPLPPEPDPELPDNPEENPE